MSRPAIQVEALSKRYAAGGREPYHRFSELLVRAGRQLANGVYASRRSNVGSSSAAPCEHVWALRDVAFEVAEGQVLGIIGRNGAGKSTLLKILSRISLPTAGRFGLRGRVASLLEVGTGFHPELTGRDNIYLNGAVLGMTRSEVRRKFDAIVDFAETRRFLDTPVKHYSTGMHMRLAFAIAAHLEPEILIVDEVLAVGDAGFQRKCIGRMGEVARQGRTVLLVSHDLTSIGNLAERCILLDSGQVTAQGAAADVIDAYSASFRTAEAYSYRGRPSPTEATITRVELETSNGGSSHRFGERLHVHIEIDVPRKVEDPRLTLQIVNARGCPVACFWLVDAEHPILQQAGTYLASCRIDSPRLYWGQYTLTAWLGSTPVRDICPFEVSMHGQRRDIPWSADACTYLEDGDWTLSQLSAEEAGNVAPLGLESSAIAAPCADSPVSQR